MNIPISWVLRLIYTMDKLAIFHIYMLRVTSGREEFVPSLSWYESNSLLLTTIGHFGSVDSFLPPVGWSMCRVAQYFTLTVCDWADLLQNFLNSCICSIVKWWWQWVEWFSSYSTIGYWFWLLRYNPELGIGRHLRVVWSMIKIAVEVSFLVARPRTSPFPPETSILHTSIRNLFS